MEITIQQLAIVLAVAALVGGFARLFRLPMIFAYLVAGAVLAGTGVVPEATSGLYRLFGEIGIMFLLFLIGMEINYSSLRLVGMTAIVVGLGQIVISAVIGTMIGILLGYPPLTAGYLGVIMAFASTVVVVKVLSEKHEMNSLHGKIILGILLMQDFLAMVALVTLAGFDAGQGVNAGSMLGTVMIAVLFFVFMLWVGRSFVPRVMHEMAHVQELMFVGTIAWLFIVAAVATKLGLSIEIGGFLAGIALANSSEQFHLSNRMRPLRDFFLVLLFISLGTSLSIANLSTVIGPVIVITLAVVLINPLVVTIILRFMGYHHRTAILSGLHISQLSEFSLVVAAIGARLGHMDPTIVSTITLAAIVSIGISSFLMLHSETVYRFMRRYIRTSTHDPERKVQARYDVVMIGAHRLGRNILRNLGKTKVLVIDYDPDVIARLQREGIDVSYGDIGDEEVLDGIIRARPRVVLSTSPDLEDNIGILATLRLATKVRATVIVRAESERDAAKLYRAGADFVLLPHLMSGLSIGDVLRRKDSTMMKRWRTNDLKYLHENT